MAFQLVCHGEISLNEYDAPICSMGWETQVASLPFDISQIDPEVALNFFGLGFLVFLIPFSIVLGGKLLLDSMR